MLNVGKNPGLVVGTLRLLQVIWSVFPAYAAESSTGKQIGAKLLRGAVNFTTGWVELFKQPYVIGTEQGWARGIVQGPIEGIGMFVVRTSGGVYEVVTFFIPVPPGYEPMVTPDYVWEPDSRAGT